jgi:hypothetical protein
MATRLAANAPPLFPGHVKLRLWDVSIVGKPGTLLMWYDILSTSGLTEATFGGKIETFSSGFGACVWGDNAESLWNSQPRASLDSRAED